MQDFVQELECVSQEPKDESDGGEEEAEVPQVLCDVGVFFCRKNFNRDPSPVMGTTHMVHYGTR